ncbi:hypothetical protein [Streptomyces sp. NPDC017556]|uniref:hypothetical protein n=1 Tax=Streptomyces sp. NPDC017556 TaxID=3365002 RepID=UPI0037AA7DAC
MRGTPGQGPGKGRGDALGCHMGCGTGSLTTWPAHAFPRADTVGVDADPLLREAGFSGAATVRQCDDDSVLVAVR